MNIFTRDIAAIAGVSMDQALVIHNFIDSNWLVPRWSEVTNHGLKKAVRLALAMGALPNTTKAL